MSFLSRGGAHEYTFRLPDTGPTCESKGIQVMSRGLSFLASILVFAHACSTVWARIHAPYGDAEFHLI